jgi:DNA primase
MDAGNWYYTDTKAFNLDERVILPFEYNNKIVGYTARLTKRPKSNSIPKYITKSPQSFLFNYDKQTNVKYTIVCEGPFDALMVNGVAVCGNHCNSRQIDLLNHLPTKKIVVPDKDGKDSNLMDVAIENKWHISLPEWPNEVKDICDAVAYYGRLEALLTILYAKEYNKIKIKIKQKKWLR